MFLGHLKRCQIRPFRTVIRGKNMANERLQSAMKSAGVDIEAIVEATNVDPKTVYRWIKGRVPHVHHCQKVASLLNVLEDEIWTTNRTRVIYIPIHTAVI